MKTFLSRQVIMTTLDEIPRGLRALPGCIAMNQREIDAIERNAEDDRETVDKLVSIAFAETAADARLTMVAPKKRTRRLGPSTRLALLRALSPGGKIANAVSIGPSKG